MSYEAANLKASARRFSLKAVKVGCCGFPRGMEDYFRLHGAPGYRHKYSIDEFEHLRDMIGSKETYVLFNNLNMYDDTLAFIRLLAGK